MRARSFRLPRAFHINKKAALKIPGVESFKRGNLKGAPGRPDINPS
jgi:hypothetical protein